MIDVRVDSSAVEPNQYPTWDLHIENGVVPFVTDENEEQQRANVAVFVQLGTVPQIPEMGVDWVGFFLKRITFGDLDTAIRAALYASESYDFEPSYDIVDDAFYTTIKRI